MTSKNLLLIPGKVRQLRLRRDLSQRTVAEEAFLAQTLLCAIEKGRKVAGTEQVERLGKTLGCGPEEIEQLKALATHDQIIDLMVQRYDEEYAEMMSLVVQAKAVLSQEELGQIKSLVRKCISAKQLLEDPRSML